MKTKYFMLLAGALIMMAACKKNEYSDDSTSTQPVFTFNGTINNALVTIQAGVSNYYMNTSYAKNNGVYSFTGEFTNVSGSSTSPNSLEFFFEDNTQNQNTSSSHIDSLLAPGYFSYSTPLGQGAYIINFITAITSFNQSPGKPNYQWDYGDGTTYSGQDGLSHLYSHPGIYRVILTIISGGSTSTDTNNVVVGQVGNAFTGLFFCYFGINTPNVIQVSDTERGVQPFSYLWSFGDGTTSAERRPTHTYANPGIYQVKCACTDATGYTAIQRLNVIIGVTGCAGGFMQYSDSAIANPLNLNNIGVQWYDNTGKLWTSENNHQHPNSVFQVTAVSDYQKNTAGQAVKKISANVTCELYNSTGTDSIPFKGNAVFGVAHY